MVRNIPTRIAIMLATYKGQEYVKAQIQSICEQDISPTALYVSDDSPDEATLTIIQNMSSDYPEIEFHFMSGPQKGFAENFRNLILNIPDDERIMFFDFSAKYIIYSEKKAIIDQGQITLSDIEDELNRHFANYHKIVDEKGRYKLWKPYFTKEDIKSIYKIAEQKLEETE